VADMEIVETETTEELDDVAGDSARLLEAYRSAVEREETDENIFFQLGQNLEEAGMEEEAVEAFRQAARLAPGDANIQFIAGSSYSILLGKALFANEGWSELASLALWHFEKAINIEPTHLEAIIGAVDCFLLLDRFDEALDLCRRWFYLVENDPVKECDSLFKMAIGRLLAGDDDEAANYCALMRDKVAEVPEAYLCLGLLAFRGEQSTFTEIVRQLRLIDAGMAQSLLKLSQQHSTLTYRDFCCELLSVAQLSA
jgi:tetratricopeptide (TPR) repeat protein